MGRVYLVGAGPGDPELLTLRALRVLQRADVVLYDRLVSPAVLACARPEAERVYVGKDWGEGPGAQARILRLLADYARRYDTVVRLKGGDPLVFGRGGEEWAFLRARGVEVELVPGLTSALAVPGLAGIPVTFRGLSRSFAVVTGHACAGEPDWHRLAGVDTLVILMGVRRRAAIARALIAAGRPPEEPVAFVERGTTPSERVVRATRGEVAQGTVDVTPPAVFVVGPVTRLRERLRPGAAGDTPAPAAAPLGGHRRPFPVFGR